MKRGAVLALVSALCLSGCQHMSSYGDGRVYPVAANSMSVAMPDCRSRAEGQARGWIKIFIPERLHFRSRFRHVTFGADMRQATPEAQFDGAGHPDEPRRGHGHDAGSEPFHIYLGPTRNRSLDPFPDDPNRPYILVSLIIPESSDTSSPDRERDYFFAQLFRPDVFAVGLYAADRQNAVSSPARRRAGSAPLLCGRSSVNPSVAGVPPDAGSRQVASFYLDTRSLKQDPANPLEASYNILLQPYAAGETPVIVDPKIYNDG